MKRWYEASPAPTNSSQHFRLLWRGSLNLCVTSDTAFGSASCQRIIEFVIMSFFVSVVILLAPSRPSPLGTSTNAGLHNSRRKPVVSSAISKKKPSCSLMFSCPQRVVPLKLCFGVQSIPLFLRVIRVTSQCVSTYREALRPTVQHCFASVTVHCRQKRVLQELWFRIR